MKPSRALELAELALLVARNVALGVPGSDFAAEEGDFAPGESTLHQGS